MTQGRRVDWPSEGIIENGDYAKAPDGTWYAMTPTGYLASLRAHDITEHEDGTISAAPSILVTQRGRSEGWHGFLERGIWREV